MGKDKPIKPSNVPEASQEPTKPGSAWGSIPTYPPETWKKSEDPDLPLRIPFTTPDDGLTRKRGNEAG